eukprot:PhM_4_TR806/c0_g1_i1/m.55097
MSSPLRPRSASPTSSTSRQAWIPNGPLVRSPSAQRRPMTSSSSRRRKAVLRSHVFLENALLSPHDPQNSWWLYGAVELRMHVMTTTEAQQYLHNLIDSLVDKMKAKHAQRTHAEEAMGGLDITSILSGTMTSNVDSAYHPPGFGGGYHPMSMEPNRTDGALTPGGADATASSGPSCKGHLIIDLVATKKLIMTGVTEQLGRDVYKYAEERHPTSIATSFVGITDNTARRVGRDIYCQHEELSDPRQKADFSAIDNVHLFVVYPQ